MLCMHLYVLIHKQSPGTSTLHVPVLAGPPHFMKEADTLSTYITNQDLSISTPQPPRCCIPKQPLSPPLQLLKYPSLSFHCSVFHTLISFLPLTILL